MAISQDAAVTWEGLRRIRNCLPEIAASGLRPPRNDTGRRHSQVCHCEAPQEPWQSRRMQPEHGKAPGEFAGAFPRLPRRACALLAMTREEGTPKFVIARFRRSRGNLAGCSRNTGKPPANSQVRSRDRRPRRFIFPAAKNQGQAIGLPLCFVLLQLRVAHEDGRELCAGGVAGRLEAAVLAVDDARADAPAQRVNSP